MDVRSRLRQSIEAAGISQAEAARRAGMSAQNLSAFFQGKYKTITALPAFAKTLGVPLAWLTTGDGPAPPWAVSHSTAAPAIEIANAPDALATVGTVGAADGGQRGVIFDHPEMKKLPDGIALFHVVGASAYPVIYHGQYALVATKRPLHADNLAVVETPDGWVVKRWCPQPDGTQVALASPDGGRGTLVFPLTSIGRRYPVVGVLFE